MREFLIYGDAQQSDAANSWVQSTCWITAAFKQTFFHPINLFLTTSRSLNSVLLVHAWQRTLSCLEEQPMAKMRNRDMVPLSMYTVLSKVYHHCHSNSSWTRGCHTMGRVVYAGKSISSLHWDHRVNSWGILVNIIPSVPNIHMVWYLQRASTPHCIQSRQCLWVRARTRPAGTGC